jgi:flagellar hook protein FlgE
MALTSTLFTGLSGLDVNQTRLNVVGNNIANANTIGFKSSRALFKPQFYVTDNPGGPPDANFGGMNPSQRGLGAVVASIEKNYAQGAIETTGKGTDLAIDGEGFFVVEGRDRMFTRDGSFILNQDNQLVTTSGEFVQGFGVDDQNNVIVGQLDKITIPLGALTKAEATEKVELSGNLRANGQIATSGTLLLSQPLTDAVSNPGSPTAPSGSTPLVDLETVDSSGNPSGTAVFQDGETLTIAGRRSGRSLPPLSLNITTSTTVDELNAFLNQALGIDTTIVTGSYTPGATLAAASGDPSDTARLNIRGNVGTENALSLTGSNAVSNPVLVFAPDSQVQANGESVFTSFVAYDSLGTPLTINLTAVLEEKTADGTSWRFYAYSGDDTDSKEFAPPPSTSDGIRIGTGVMNFDGNGKLVGSTGSVMSLTRENTGAASPLQIAMDFSQMNSLSDQSSASSTMFGEADGKPIGTLSSFSIGPDGTITGSFDNGLNQTLGQVAVATFDNPGGLVDKGGNRLMAGGNSGTPKIVPPQQLGAGSIRAGALELSNVDLSQEFINLIISSTGFSAASRVITTSDQLLTELLNTSR